MRSWLRIGIVATGALVLLFGPLLSAPASAQVSERYRVMVTNLMPLNDANDDFGKDLAKELRELINQFGTHQPVDEREIRDAADRFDLDMEDLDCVVSMQLAGQINANVVFCGTYTEDKDADTFSLQGIQFAAPGGPAFMIADKTWHKDDHEVAAQEIASEFETYVDQLRTAQFCGDYYQSKDWEGAERTCTAALEMNPGNSRVRFVYANVLFQTERLEEAYQETLQVIEADPLHEGALQLAGYVAANLGLNDEAREHYSAYLALNPGDAIIRMQIAHDLAQAGDVEGAMLLTEEGLAIEPDNVDLLLRHAAYATLSAQNLTAAAQPGAPLSAEVAALYRKAMGSYEVVYEVQGDEMEVAHILNMIAGFTELEQLQDAIDMAARALETHGDDASLWSRYADVLKRAERVEEAIAALNEVEARDPGFANVKARQGSWLLETGQEEEALGFLQEAVEKGEQTADAMAVLLLANAHSLGVVPKDWGHALRVIGLAKSFENEVSEGTRGQLDFWHGFSLFNQALEQERPQTLETAQLTLPKFQQAARFFVLPRVAAYAEANAIGLQQFRDATQQYIEIQEAIIQRGR